MPHPLVGQLRFARSEFQRALVGITAAEARQRFLPMNCISWNIGHLAWQEQRYWLWRAQGRVLLPHVNEQFAYGAPASAPDLAATWAAWHAIIHEVDPWLNAVTAAELQAPVMIDGQPSAVIFGSLLQRTIYHYWYHTGENMAIRQMLGHGELPEFVGNLDDEAPYQPE